MRRMRTGLHRRVGGLSRWQRVPRPGWVAAVAGWALLLPAAEGLCSRTGDYLSSEEIDKVRDSQKPHQRMSVLNDIFKRRMKGAVSSWEVTEASEGRRGAESKRQDGGPAESGRSLSFREWLEEVAMCLDDIDTNLESYPLDRPLSVWDLETGRPIRMNHKKFRNALKKLRDSLTEFDRWLAGKLDRLEGSEGQMAEEIADFLSDLAEVLEETIELAGGDIQDVAPAERRARP
jgi:hypothetical protein